jgi:hypothetical protein
MQKRLREAFAVAARHEQAGLRKAHSHALTIKAEARRVIASPAESRLRGRFKNRPARQVVVIDRTDAEVVRAFRRDAVMPLDCPSVRFV